MAPAKTIAILSIKGGVGKTFLAVSLAAALAKQENQKVLLLDMDYRVVGDMARMLDVPPSKALIDLIVRLKEGSKDVRAKDIVTHHVSNVDFVPCLLSPQQSPHLEPGLLKEVFDLFRPDYDFIVVDAGCGFSEITLYTLNEANLILLVTNPDVLSISQTKWLLEMLQSLHFPINMIKIVLNRAESFSSISLHDIAMALRAEIIAQVPSEGKIVMEALNRGVSISSISPRSKVSKALEDFAYVLVNSTRLFMPHQDIDMFQLQELSFLEKVGSFWERVGKKETIAASQLPTEYDEIIVLKKRVHQRLIDELNLKRLEFRGFSEKDKQELKERAEKLVSNFLAEETGGLISSLEDRDRLVKEIMDEALGLGPLEELLADPAVTDIMVNNKDDIYIERFGKLERTKKKFISNDQVKTTIERIIAPIGRRIDESVPMVDARLPDGSRVNAIIPPLALTGPTITIRKFRKERFHIEELAKTGSLSIPMAEIIKACVISRKNIIVSGGTGSGKTTVLNVLSSFIPDNERIVTIEDAAELKLDQEHWIRLESRPPNIEGKGAIVIRDLFRNTLRMRPDRIVIGECRGLETLDMLQAMNTGHDGSMTTIHANSTHDVLSRLDSMILMSGIELPVRAIREMIASAVDLIVHTARLSDGKRKIMQITEITGMLDETHVGLKDIFAFRQVGVDKEGNVLGDFHATGYIPSFYDDLKSRGIELPKEIFKKA